MMRSVGACEVPRPKLTAVSGFRTICANLSTVPLNSDGVWRYTSSSIVHTGSRGPPCASSHVVASEGHSTVDSRGESFQLSLVPQHGHAVSCSGVLGSPGDRSSASFKVSGVAATPTQRPMRSEEQTYE